MSSDISDSNTSTPLPSQNASQEKDTPAAPPLSSNLDELLSPSTSDFDKPQDVRESIAESDFNDMPLDEVRLSTASTLQDASLLSDLSPSSNGRPRSASELSLAPTLLDTRGPSHKKTASTSTIRSVENAPWILARVDAQKTEAGNRNSVEGQLKLQEEFERLHLEKEEEEPIEAAGIDWEFWGAVMSDYQEFASTRSQDLAKAIEKGIPGTLRGMMWQLMAASKDPELEAAYVKLLKEPSTHEKAITRDLGRTFPHHDFFHDGEGIGQENLFNVLKAYSLYDPEVGYCQGLPFVVAVLLLNMPDEEAFAMLVRLMYSYDLRSQFTPEMPRLQLRLFQFDRLIEELLPVLHVHFLRQGVKSSMFCSQWFLTLFSYRFPLNVVFRIYDHCLANGIEAIFGFSIALLQKNEEKLLSQRFDEIIAFLNTQLLEVYTINVGDKNPIVNVDEFVQDATSLRITPFVLDSYAREYEEMVRVRDAQLIEMDTLRNSNRNLSAQVRTLEASLAQLNAEHVEVLNELVLSRLRNEETEGELVRYKLLYAEAMHESQDAMSSHRMSSASMLSTRKASSRSSGS